MRPVAKGFLPFRPIAHFCGNPSIAAFYLSGTSWMPNPHQPLHLSRVAGHLGTVTRRKWYILIVVFLLAVSCSYLYTHRQGANLSSTQGPLGLGPTPNVWTPVDRSAEGFRLWMPVPPRQIQVPAYNESGGADQVSMLYSYPNAETSYSIAWEDNPPIEKAMEEDPMQTLNSARNGALARTQTTLVSEESGTRQGYPAVDFVGRNDGGGVFNARLILVGRRLYMLMAAFPSAGARRQADVDRFFDSFHVSSTNPN